MSAKSEQRQATTSVTAVDPQDMLQVEAESLARQVQFALSTSKFMVVAVIIMVALLVPLWLSAQEYTQLLFLLVLTVLIGVGWGLFPVLHRRGQTDIGYYLGIITFLIVIFVSPLLLPDLIPSIGVGYILIVVIGNLLLGAKSSRWLIGVCTLGLAADVVLGSTVARDWFPKLDETVGLIAGAIVMLPAFLTSALIVRLVVLRQEEQFREARLANLEIERRAATERESKAYLEDKVATYMAFVERVARGDLKARLPVNGDGHVHDEEDDLYRLGLNLNAMVEGLSAMAGQIREMATSLASAAAEILAATTQQIASTTEQETAVTQTMTTVEEVVAAVQQTAERAQDVADASHQSVDVSRAGQEAVADTVNGMQLIRQRVEAIGENILALSERTQQIGEIIQTVNEIADQSKLLALNASIEAARAGEEGKGFAVVAMEVRQLAEQSRQATARVRDILHEIQQATNTAVMVTEEGSKGTEQGMTLVERAGEAIQGLAATLTNAAQAATQIAASTHQQTNGMEQLAAAMVSIKQASTEAAVSTRQAERSAQDLSAMARQMEDAVARYQIA